MIAALIASQILLGLLVLALGVAVLALARQIGVLHERIAPAGALAVNQQLRVGDPAPALEVEAIDGERFSIVDAGVSRLVFFLSPDCPVCKTLLPILRSTARSEKDWLSVVFASDGGELEEHRKLRRDHGIEAYPYVLSETLGRTFGVAKLPYAVLIDENGKIASMGLVNSREHLESLFEAKDRGVASLQDYIERRGRSRPDNDKQRMGA